MPYGPGEPPEVSTLSPPTNDNILELDTRRRIYKHVCQVPGAHLRKIQRDLEMPLGTLEYHLRQLEKHDLVATRDDGRFKAYFPTEGMDRRDRDYLYYLRQEMPRHLALEIAHKPGIGFQELKEKVPVSGSTVSFHLKKLVEAGLIEDEKVGRQKIYRAIEPGRIQRIVVKYRKSFADDLVDRFADAWLDIGV